MVSVISFVITANESEPDIEPVEFTDWFIAAKAAKLAKLLKKSALP